MHLCKAFLFIYVHNYFCSLVIVWSLQLFLFNFIIMLRLRKFDMSLVYYLYITVYITSGAAVLAVIVG